MASLRFENKDFTRLSTLVTLSLAVIFISNVQNPFGNYDIFPYVTPGKIAHYYINYFDFGFTKRGLIGSLIKSFGNFPSVGFVRFLALVIGSAVCLAFSYILCGMRDYFDRLAYFLITGLMILNPGTIPNLGYDIGRFDQLLILCSILSFYFIRKGDLIKLAALSIIGVLIHELYIIMFFPILLFATFFRSKFNIKQIGYLLLPVAGVLILLFFFGKIESQSVQQIAETIEGFDMRNYGTIWKNSLLGNIEYTTHRVSTYSFGTILELSLGAVFTFLVFTLLAMISTFNKLNWLGYAVIILASLPIFFLGIDYSRWYSLMIINGFMYFVFSIKNSGISSVKITVYHKIVISLILILGIILGPIGIIRSFPLFDFF